MSPRIRISPRAARFASLAVGIVVLAVLAVVLTPNDVDELADLAHSVQAIGPVGAIAAIAVGVLILVPRTAMSVASGLVFGWWAGFGYMTVGSLLGASAAFAIGRILGRDYIADKLAAWSRVDPGAAVTLRARLARRVERGVAASDAWLSHHGLVGMWVIRVIPISHFGVLSYVCGTSSVRYRDFLAATAISSIPTCLGYTAVGASVFGSGGVSVALLGAFGMSLLSIAAAFLGKRWLSKREARRHPEQSH
ncbi:MAG TPA: VTT domain-containing protein [Stackebrandtia sp.]|uniref:TVP38/TMEM64 family protein n=1 Tax=Stackebrandtia sp. TaxID=2023065 RepID=UPI002D74BF79|nr:VTT domain-containing protein [Stackebrandtia sp.]HZE38537.1 VTT domain-containing protein [Stackebrandtia sp.]